MELKFPLPCSQFLAIGPSSKSDESSPHPHIPFHSDPLSYVLSFHLRLCLSNGLFPSGFSTKILYALQNLPSLLRVQHISFSLI